MLKVGEFARLAQVSIRLLHYYDQLGLLSPATVDRSSGYRLYSADQLPRLHRILALKDLGLSLEEVARLIDGTVSAEELRGMLLLKQAELRQRVAEEQARLDRVQQRLRFIEQEGKLPEIDVIVKAVPALRVMSLRRAIPLRKSPHYVFYEAWAALRAHGLRDAVEALMCRYHTFYLRQVYAGLKPRRSLIEPAYVIDMKVARDIPVEGGGRLCVREWPAAEMMACTIHCGADNQRHLAHQALLHWIAQQGYALAGPTREIYLWRGVPNETSDEHVTEIQHPIRKIDAAL
jgi:DNA-binding transcriptional MerR regulator/effector-binding domain-containing protein